MPIPDPLLHEEPFVEQETLVVTREWYSWLVALINELKAELAGARTDITALQATIADHEARITALEPP
jgi:meiotically up-regulated gene 157 (Mug157) protein